MRTSIDPSRYPSLGLGLLPLSILEERVERARWQEFEAYSERPQIAWLGHASFLIVWRGARVLFDPVFRPRIGVFARACGSPTDWRNLAPTAIVLSHGHMDHMDRWTLGAFPGVALYLPEGSQALLPQRLRGQCRGLLDGQRVSLGPLTLTPVPALHGGWRYPWQRGFRALGYLLSDGERSLYFAGDTAYGDIFERLGRSGRIETALLPIGAYSPRWFLKSRHLDPDEAVAAAARLGCSKVMPYHFGAYRLSWERLDEPLPRFVACAERLGLDWRLSIGF